MSQAGSSGGGGPLPPTVPLQFTTDSGIAIPAANNLNVLGEIAGYNVNNGIQTTGSSDNLRVVLTNRSQGTTLVVNAASDNIASFTMPSTVGAAMLQGWVVAFDTSTGDAFTALMRGGAKTNGTTASIVGVDVVDIVSDASLATATVAFSVTGNNVRITVTGVAATTTQWHAVLYNTVTAV
jgi:hypothetical protein